MSKRGDLSDDTASQSHRTAESATYGISLNVNGNNEEWGSDGINTHIWIMPIYGSDPTLDAYIFCVHCWNL